MPDLRHSRILLRKVVLANFTTAPFLSRYTSAVTIAEDALVERPRISLALIVRRVPTLRLSIGAAPGPETWSMRNNLEHS
jgi:hypothetical protein